MGAPRIALPAESLPVFFETCYHGLYSMEELRGTEAIDREIMDDARRKAERLQHAAEKKAAAFTAHTSEKLALALEAERARFETKFSQHLLCRRAQLALDKERAKTRCIDTLLRQAALAFLQTLSDGEKSALLCAALDLRLAAAFPDAAPERATVIPAGKTEARFQYDSCTISVSLADELDHLLSERRGELACALLGAAVLAGAPSCREGA
jgi:hypothetical protein